MLKLKKWMILAGCFLGGILICGLGAGVGFVELSGLSYAGERHMGTVKETTLSCRLYDYENTDIYFIDHYMDRKNGRPEMVSDNSLPAGSVEMDVKYNDDFEEPYLYQSSLYGQTADGENETEEISIRVALYTDSLKIIMKYKDIFLEDLKNGQLGSYYHNDGYFSVEQIRYSPDLEGKFKTIN